MSLPYVYLTDRDLRPVTDHLPWTAIDATARYLYAGHGQVTCPATPELMAQLSAGTRRAVLMHDGQQFLAGPVERPMGPYQWTRDGAGTVTFHFTDDLALLMGRRTYPDPALSWEDQSESEDARWTATGQASSVILDLVDVNAGPGAIPARQVPHLTLDVDPAVGPTITVSTRFQWLGDELRAAVSAAGEQVGYRTTSAQGAVTFQVYETVDKSLGVRFSRALGNLRGVTWEEEIPRVTAALVAGQGEGTSRTLVERVNSAAEAEGWRVEDLVDRRDSDDTAVLEQAGDVHLAEGGASMRLATVTVDTPEQRYGDHYQLGDRVGTEPIDGLIVPELVRAVHLQATPRAGVLMTALVGSQEATRDARWLRVSREMGRRFARLEAI